MEDTTRTTTEQYDADFIAIQLRRYFTPDGQALGVARRLIADAEAGDKLARAVLEQITDEAAKDIAERAMKASRDGRAAA